MSYNYNKLALFDLDRTLIRVSTGHKTAFSIGFKMVYGIDAKIDEINYYGHLFLHLTLRLIKAVLTIQYYYMI